MSDGENEDQETADDTIERDTSDGAGLMGTVTRLPPPSSLPTGGNPQGLPMFYNGRLLIEPNSPHRTQVTLASGDYKLTCKPWNVTAENAPAMFQVDIAGGLRSFNTGGGSQEQQVSLQGGTMSLVGSAQRDVVVVNSSDDFSPFYVDIALAPA